MQIKQAIQLLRAEFSAHANGPAHTAALDQMDRDHGAALAKASAAPVGKLFLRALANPISFPGFPSVLRGAVGEVPAGFEAGARGHVERGVAEWVTATEAAPPAAPAPASAEAEQEETEEELQAKLDALEALEPASDAAPELPPEVVPEVPHKRQADCVHCGKPYPEHEKNAKKPDDALGCKGLRRGFTPPAAVST